MWLLVVDVQMCGVRTGLGEVEFLFEEIRHKAENGDESAKCRAHNVEVC
jgi:hypothetical protein